MMSTLLRIRREGKNLSTFTKLTCCCHKFVANTFFFGAELHCTLLLASYPSLESVPIQQCIQPTKRKVHHTTNLLLRDEDYLYRRMLPTRRRHRRFANTKLVLRTSHCVDLCHPVWKRKIHLSTFKENIKLLQFVDINGLKALSNVHSISLKTLRMSSSN